MTKIVVFFSGGEVSWASAKRAAKKYGTENMTLLFTDTKEEDVDLYRFIREAADNVGAPLVWLTDSAERNIWDVFDDEGMLGNSGADPCSRVLKREPAEVWLKTNCDPDDTVLVFGIDWTETHRYDGEPREGSDRRTGVKNRYARIGWHNVEAPMMDAPYLDRRDIGVWLKLEGIQRAALYEDGFPHNNCGGGCVKAGQGQFAHLLRVRPAVYARWEAGEIAFNAKRPGKKFQTILRDRRGSRTTPLSLTTLRQRIERGGQVDMFDIGGCGCFLDAA